MSTPAPISVHGAASPVSTGSNALKALQAAAGLEAGGETSAAAVHFTLDEAGTSPAAGTMSTLLNSIAQGTPATTGAAVHPKTKSAGPDRAAATDGTLLSMLQAITAVPAPRPDAPAAPTGTPAAPSRISSVPDTRSAVPPGTATASTGAPFVPAATASNTTISAIQDAATTAIVGALTGSAVVAGADAALTVAAAVLDAVLPGVAGQTAEGHTEGAVGKTASPSAMAATAAVPLPAPPAPPAATSAAATSNTAVANADETVAATAAMAALLPQASPDSTTPAKPAAARAVTSVAAPVSADAIASLVQDARPDLPPNVLQIQRQSTQRAPANDVATTASAVSPGRATAAGSSGLLAALAQTLTDSSTTMPAAPGGAASSVATVSAGFSSLLQQIADGGVRADTAAAARVHDSAASDMQLANAVSASLSPGAAPALTMPAPVATLADAGASTNAAVVSPATAAPIDTTRQNWPDALGSRVEWMLHQGLQEARIELHPRDMGSINVHIKLGNDGADVRFAATNPNVRDALESSLPRLRELLAGSGLQLAQAQVGSQMQQQDSAGRFLPQQTPARSSSPATATPAGPEAPTAAAPRVRVATLSIIDDYA